MRAQSTIVGYQIALVLVAAVVGYILYSDLHASKAMLYGGFISVMTSMVMACRLNQALKKTQQGSRRGSTYVYLGVIERLFIAVALFGLGLIWLKLSPVHVVVGLIAGQVGFMLGGFRVKG